ncbi:Uncharacterised protein [Legionella beliardensis]|uniref:Uncharacterized protein n=1 Tax=Legionella beliardensis TaxID=91822 RepID=A0A378JPS3_9GAMM|nr:hypothetical protein [Legionella beliardensis]STX55765.1 Uncharacterised protein [Legionella beliardensis]
MTKPVPYNHVGFKELQQLSHEIKTLVKDLKCNPTDILFSTIQIKVDLARNYYKNLEPFSKSWTAGLFEAYRFLHKKIGRIDALFAEAQIIMLPFKPKTNAVNAIDMSVMPSIGTVAKLVSNQVKYNLSSEQGEEETQRLRHIFEEGAAIIANQLYASEKDSLSNRKLTGLESAFITLGLENEKNVENLKKANAFIEESTLRFQETQAQLVSIIDESELKRKQEIEESTLRFQETQAQLVSIIDESELKRKQEEETRRVHYQELSALKIECSEILKKATAVTQDYSTSQLLDKLSVLEEQIRILQQENVTLKKECDDLKKIVNKFPNEATLPTSAHIAEPTKKGFFSRHHNFR